MFVLLISEVTPNLSSKLICIGSIDFNSSGTGVEKFQQYLSPEVKKNLRLHLPTYSSTYDTRHIELCIRLNVFHTRIGYTMIIALFNRC